LRVDGHSLVVHGETGAVEQAYDVVKRMLDAAVRGVQLTPDDVALAASDVLGGTESSTLPETLFRSHRGGERSEPAGARSGRAGARRADRAHRQA